MKSKENTWHHILILKKRQYSNDCNDNTGGYTEQEELDETTTRQDNNRWKYNYTYNIASTSTSTRSSTTKVVYLLPSYGPDYDWLEKKDMASPAPSLPGFVRVVLCYPQKNERHLCFEFCRLYFAFVSFWTQKIIWRVHLTRRIHT